MKIIPFASRYKEEVCQLILKIQREEFGVEISLEDQPDLLALPHSYQSGQGGFWVALSDTDQVVGTIGLLDVDHYTLALRKMFVHPDYRGKEKGTAQKLIDTAIEHAKHIKAVQIYLGTIERYIAARKFYERNGFKSVAKADLPDFFPTMSMDTHFYGLNLLG